MLKTKIINALILTMLVCGLSQHAFAQAPAPQQIALVSWVGTELNNMVNSNIGGFLNEGQSMVGTICVVLLVWYLMVGMFSQVIRNELLVELILNFMLCQMMLLFYDSPLWGGMSFHQLFSKEAQWAAATLDITAVNSVMAKVTQMRAQMEVPTALNILGYIVYSSALLNLVVIWLFCSGVTLIAHIALGFGALVGPLLIPFFIWPVMSWLFWGWVRFMIIYSLYIVSSSLVVLLYANVTLYFFNHLFAGNYTLGNVEALLLPFAVLNLLFLVAFWQCHTWAREVASGSANMGATVSGLVQTAAMAILA